MPIIRSNGKKQVILKSQPFANEEQLQKVVAENPSLLCFDGEAPLALVTRELTLPDAGYLDILMISADGLPVPVECKLARNGQARREVVGQIIDYVSVLTSMTVDELNDAVEGRLEEALRCFEHEDESKEMRVLQGVSGEKRDTEAFERRWQQVGTKLRAGEARYVIVVDEVPADLERIMRFLIQRSELDIRLVQISHYPDADGNALYVPANIVDVAPADRPSGSRPRVPCASDFQAVIDAYIAVAAPGLQTRGRAAYYRLICVKGWPRSLHYEFVNYGTQWGVEFHNESEPHRWLAEVLKKLPTDKSISYSHVLEWEPKWFRGKGRIRTMFSKQTPPEMVADAMCQLISATRDRINAALANLPKDK